MSYRGSPSQVDNHATHLDGTTEGKEVRWGEASWTLHLSIVHFLCAINLSDNLPGIVLDEHMLTPRIPSLVPLVHLMTLIVQCPRNRGVWQTAGSACNLACWLPICQHRMCISTFRAHHVCCKVHPIMQLWWQYSPIMIGWLGNCQCRHTSASYKYPFQPLMNLLYMSLPLHAKRFHTYGHDTDTVNPVKDAQSQNLLSDTFLRWCQQLFL